MNTSQVALLGALQGATEFLPVSSSGHLRLVELLMGGVEESLALEVALHVGTLGAVLLFYRADLRAMVLSLRPGGDAERRRWIGLVALASLPTALIGLGMKRAGVEHLGLLAVGIGLLVSAFANFSTSREVPEGGSFTAWDALLIGCVQGFAVLPGISRSGSTIATGMARGVSGVEAARFSFLCSIPAVAGAAMLTVIDLLEVGVTRLDPKVVGFGAAISFVVGYACLALLLRQIKTGTFRLWGFYCLILGCGVLTLAFSGTGAP